MGAFSMYKNYTTNQVVLPIDLAICLPENDVAFAIRSFVDSLPDSLFEDYFQRFGRPAYHPRMMLALLLCAYTQGITSGRKIEDLLQDSIRMRWLAQEEHPNFRTINRFRINPLMDSLLESSFLQFRSCLLQSGLITSEKLFIDGTKIEADANKYTFVWKKSISNYEASLDEKAKKEYRKLVKQEILPEMIQEMKGTLTTEELHQIQQLLQEKETRLTQTIKETPEVAKRKELRHEKSLYHQAGKHFQDYTERKTRYTLNKEILGERNSYSKTDHDATFMRMKDDHMRNGQLKPGFNIQAATENQYVLAYDIFQNPTDTRTLIPFIEKLKQQFPLPQFLVADAGYGGEENYEYLSEQPCKAIIPYPMYFFEQTKKFKQQIHRRENWAYEELEDYFICPNKQRVVYSHYSQRTDAYGFTRNFKVYECEDCTNCPLRSKCTKAAEGKNRKTSWNLNWEYLKTKARQRMEQDDHFSIYQQRKIDVEPVFGAVKTNQGFTRFHVRSKEKVHREMGLVFLAHNFRKLCKRLTNYGENQVIQTLLGG